MADIDEDSAASPFDYMSFEQIAAFMKDADGRTATKYGGLLTQRLYEIALYDNHLPEGDRKGAFELLGIIKSTMEIAFSNSPEALRAYVQANSVMEEGARQIGVGSLSWLIIENDIAEGSAMIEFASRPEYRHLLDDFYTTVDRVVADQIKAIIG